MLYPQCNFHYILFQLATIIGLCFWNKINDLVLEYSNAFNTYATFSQPMPEFPSRPLKSPNRTSSLSNTADNSPVSSSADHFVRAFFSLMSTPTRLIALLSSLYLCLQLQRLYLCLQLRTWSAGLWEDDSTVSRCVIYLAKVTLIEWTFWGKRYNNVFSQKYCTNLPLYWFEYCCDLSSI